MTIRHMKIFVAVCRQGSVTGAAQALYLAQPSVSLAIRELEEYYGVRLFDRISRRMQLTQEGRQMFSYASHIVSLFDEMEQSIKNWDSLGTLRVGSSITIGNFLMPRLTALFYRSHPDMKVEVHIDNSEEIERMVLKGELDFALIEGSAHSPAVVCERFSDDHLVVVCGGSHPFSVRREITLEELLTCDFLLREKGSGTRELVDSVLLLHDVSVEPVWESTSTGALVAAVAQGLGISILPHMLAQPGLKAKQLHELKVTGVEFRRRYFLIRHQRKFLSGSAQDFIRLVKERYSYL